MKKPWTVLAFGLVAVLCMAPTGCGEVLKIPEAKVRIVDAETGEPQEWVYVEYSAGKNVGIIDEHYEATYINASMFRETQNGWVTLPERTALVMSARYQGCSVIIESPGHAPEYLDCDAYRALLEREKTGTTIRLKKATTSRLDQQVLVLGHRNPVFLKSYGPIMFHLVAQEMLLKNWEYYYKQDPRAVSAGYAHYMEGYLLSSYDADRVNELADDKKDLIRERVCAFFQNEVLGHESVRKDLDEFTSGRRSFLLREVGCVSK